MGTQILRPEVFLFVFLIYIRELVLMFPSCAPNTLYKHRIMLAIFTQKLSLHLIEADIYDNAAHPLTSSHFLANVVTPIYE